MIKYDTPAALDFLNSWMPGGPWTLTAIEPDTKEIETRTFTDVNRTRHWIDKWQGKRNLYFSVNQPKARTNKKAGKADIGLGIGLHVDLDAPASADLSAAKTALISKLQNYRLRPTVIIDSGGGAQGFWRAREPAVINGPDSVARFEALNRGIENALDGDHCHNIDRIMRLPGTLNLPDEKKRGKGREIRLARVIESDWDRRYDLDEFEPADAPKPNGHDTSAGTGTGKGRDGSRSAKAFRLGAKMKREGATFDEFCEALRTNPKTAEWYREQGNSKRAFERIWNRANTGRDLPTIKITGGRLPVIVDQVDELVLEHDPELFQRGGMIVRPAMERIDIADGGKALAWRLVQVRQQHLVDRLTRIIDFQKYDKRSDEWYSINCPPEVAGAYLERVGLWRLPIITGIVDAPTLRPDGSIIETPGYDQATGLLYKPACAYESIFPNPTMENAKAALKHLCKLIEHFPFVADSGEPADAKPAGAKRSASRSVALSLILTACSRHAFARAPMHGYDAPVPGSGKKSLLVDCASMIASGHEGAVMNAGKSEEEFEKRLGAALLAGDPLISFDNCERPLGGELLCQCLTQCRVKVRILGKSEQPTLPSDATFCATGNNLVLVGDVTRRAIVSRLDPKVERPEEREFDENPIEMIRRDRATYVRAALTCLRAYIVAGKPKQGRKPLGSYEEWSRLVRDALIWLGEPDPVATMEKVRNEDPVLRDLAEVLNCWFAIGETPESREMTVKRVVEIANQKKPGDQFAAPEFVKPDLRDALSAVAGDRGGGISPTALGKWLGKNKGRVVNGLYFAPGRGTARSGAVRWRVCETPNASVA